MSTSRSGVGAVEVVAGLALAAFALFVGVQIARRPARVPIAAQPAVELEGAPHAIAASGQHAAAPAASPAQPASPDMRGTVTQSAIPAPQRDDDDVRARIASAHDTYMADMLVDLNGALVRWPDLRERGLRVWVQSMTSVRDWDLRYAQMARNAFADWDASGLPMRLDFVLDSAGSDVHIMWIDRFPADAGQRIGTTNRTTDQHGWIVRADIVVAVHDSAGRTIPPTSLAGIVRHEAGHAVGLGHSRDPRTKMFPIEVTSEISAADRATLHLLYTLPPGLVR